MLSAWISIIMRTAVFLLTLAIGAESVSEGVLNQAWKDFQSKFSRGYASPHEIDTRQAIFKENLENIETHNARYADGKETHRKGITPFTDWTTEEFTGYVNKYKFETNRLGKVHKFGNKVSVPDFVDWRLQKAVTEVKNQGHCGSCWSFSATGAMEGQAKITLGKRVSLSEQNLIDCADQAYSNYGCNGGNMNTAFYYVQINGIEKELDYPYVAHQGYCDQHNAELYVDDYFFTESTEEALKEAVARIGPISVAMEATNELQNYVGGVLLDRTCTAHLNHGVLAVGYGNENGQDYWLLKNSWGSDWGEQGYLKLARNKYNNCGIALQASYPLVKNEK